MEDNEKYVLTKQYNKLDKDQIVLMLRAYTLRLNSICRDITSELSIQILNQIKQSRQYYDTWIKNKRYGKAVEAFKEKSREIRDNIVSKDKYIYTAGPIYYNYMNRSITSYFDTYFIMEYKAIRLADKIKYIEEHLIDLHAIEEIENNKEKIQKWLSVYLDEIPDDAKELQKIIAKRFNRYLVYGLWEDEDMPGVLRERLKYIADET